MCVFSCTMAFNFSEKIALNFSSFGAMTKAAIALSGIVFVVILMVFFRLVKGSKGEDLRHDGCFIEGGLLQFPPVRPGGTRHCTSS